MRAGNVVRHPVAHGPTDREHAAAACKPGPATGATRMAHGQEHERANDSANCGGAFAVGSAQRRLVIAEPACRGCRSAGGRRRAGPMVPGAPPSSRRLSTGLPPRGDRRDRAGSDRALSGSGAIGARDGVDVARVDSAVTRRSPSSSRPGRRNTRATLPHTPADASMSLIRSVRPRERANRGVADRRGRRSQKTAWRGSPGPGLSPGPTWGCADLVLALLQRRQGGWPPPRPRPPHRGGQRRRARRLRRGGPRPRGPPRGRA